MRNGVPFASDDAILTNEPDSIDSQSTSKTGSVAGDTTSKTKVGLGAAGRSAPQRPSSPSMSLGPSRVEPLGDPEVVVSKSKKKAD